MTICSIDPLPWCDRGDLHPEPGDLPTVLQHFETISLAEIEEIKAQLLFRMESKHLMTVEQCRDLVQCLAGSYRVLEIRRSRMGRYETLYYDDPGFRTYLQHHNGKGNRYKLRFRHYGSSGETYLEVKKKSNKGTTEKQRISASWSPGGFRSEQAEFLRSAFPYDYREFFPVLWTEYDRFTLVSNESPERITFDTGLSFRTGQRRIAYPALVIGELKYEKGVRISPARAAIHALGIRTRGFSKYCIGVSLLYEQLKHNRFKPNLLFLSRLPSREGAGC